MHSENKEGTVKVPKAPRQEPERNEVEFFKPLAELGIEFGLKETKVKEEMDRYPERADTSHGQRSAPGVFDSVKKAFGKRPSHAPHPGGPRTRMGENPALKEALSKVLGKKGVEAAQPAPVKAPEPAPISLEALKNKMKDVTQTPAGSVPGGKDRAASPEEMDKLKNLIAEKTPVLEVPKPPVTDEVREPTTPPANANPAVSTAQSPESANMTQPVSPAPGMTQQANGPKEVPEDILRKILE